MHTKRHTHPADAEGPIYVHGIYGTTLLQPGESTEVHAPGTPEGTNAETSEAPLTAMEKLQKTSIKNIQTLLPDLNESELQELISLEQAAPAPRSSLVPQLEQAILAIKAKTPPPAP